MAASPLVNVTIPVRAKLSALWAALMFCYVYGDYFGLYVPGKLSGMIRRSNWACQPEHTPHYVHLAHRSRSHGVPLARFTGSHLPLGQHRAWRVLHCCHGAHHAWRMGLLHATGRRRNRRWAANDLVCVELASRRRHTYRR